MPVKDYCTQPAVEIGVDATARDAARRMKEEGLGCLFVTGNGPIGVVTDRDLALEVFGRKLDADAVRLGEIARASLVSVPADAPLAEAARLMRRHWVRRLPVVDSGGKLVGVISSDDLLEVVAGELGGLATALSAQRPAAGRGR